MKLKNNLYKIETIEDSAVSVSLQGDCVIYKAHFPGKPITPGVCLLQMALELLEELTGRSLELVAVKNVKFLAVLSPERAEVVKFSFTKVAWDGEQVAAQVAVSDEACQYAKISFTLRTV